MAIQGGGCADGELGAAVGWGVRGDLTGPWRARVLSDKYG